MSEYDYHHSFFSPVYVNSHINSTQKKTQLEYSVNYELDTVCWVL